MEAACWKPEPVRFCKTSLYAQASFDFESFKKAVTVAVGALNEVLEEGLPLHPLPEQQESVTRWRQIGLGIMGLADMLIKLGLVYGEQEALELCDQIGFIMADTAIAASAMLAKEQGAYPGYDMEQVMSTPYFQANTSEATVELVKKYGLRNSQLLTIAPTGTLSTMLGISGGIEPVYANYMRERRNPCTARMCTTGYIPELWNSICGSSMWKMTETCRNFS